MKYGKVRRWSVFMAAALLLWGFAALTLFPVPRFSPAENRLLGAFPALTLEGLKDGTWTAGADTYAAERFPYRSILRQGSGLWQLATGRLETGGVLYCTDGSLAKRMSPNKRALRENLTVLQKWQAAWGERLTVAVAPRRIDARQAVLPPLYDAAENEAVWETLQATLPMALTFPMLTKDAHWYRTDHHWSTEGAYAAYCRLGEVLGYTPFSANAFEKELVATDFKGTSAAAAGLPFLTSDRIFLWRYEGDTALTVCADGRETDGMYDPEKLQTSDKYGVFFGGNHGILTVESGADRPRLLLIKDSFANALIPFLARHFDIIALDPRYTDASPAPWAEAAERVLVLCNMQTLHDGTFFRENKKCLAYARHFLMRSYL